MELSGLNIKKFVIFSQKKSFLIFRELETTKNSLYFRKRNFLIFQETETLKNLLYFRREFSSQKNKKKNTLKMFLIFRKMEFSSPKLKKLLLFQEGTYRTWTWNEISAPKKFLDSWDGFVIFIAVKHRKILCESNSNIVWLKGTLMQNRKSANIFCCTWKWYVEDFTLKHLLHFEICTRETCEKFVYKHSEAIE